MSLNTQFQESGDRSVLQIPWTFVSLNLGILTNYLGENQERLILDSGKWLENTVAIAFSTANGALKGKTSYGSFILDRKAFFPVSSFWPAFLLCSLGRLQWRSSWGRLWIIDGLNKMLRSERIWGTFIFLNLFIQVNEVGPNFNDSAYDL